MDFIWVLQLLLVIQNLSFLWGMSCRRIHPILIAVHLCVCHLKLKKTLKQSQFIFRYFLYRVHWNSISSSKCHSRFSCSAWWTGSRNKHLWWICHCICCEITVLQTINWFTFLADTLVFAFPDYNKLLTFNKKKKIMSNIYLTSSKSVQVYTYISIFFAVWMCTLSILIKHTKILYRYSAILLKRSTAGYYLLHTTTHWQRNLLLILMSHYNTWLALSIWRVKSLLEVNRS